MKRRVRVAIAAAAPVVLLMVLGYHTYRAFFGVGTKFDAAFYANPGATQAGPFSSERYRAALATFVNDAGMVNYRGLKEQGADLDSFLLALARLDLKTYLSWDEKARIALWINAYNALTLKLILGRYPIKSDPLVGLAYPKSSIQQIPGRWDKVQWLVMGQRLTLDRIEHAILRGGDPALVATYGPFHEPRIHLALVCAAMGCPPLRNEPYAGERLDAQLDDQVRRFLRNPQKFRIDRGNGRVYLSSIFKWFGGDFIKKYGAGEKFAGHSDAERAVLNFISGYLGEDDRKYLETGTYSIEYLSYDWSLNEQKAL